MKKAIFSTLFSILVLGFSISLCSCSFRGANPPAQTLREENEQNGTNALRVITIGTADSGGTMYPVGNAIAQVISSHDSNIKVNISASNGSFTNVEAITERQIDMGLVSGDIAFAAYYGSEEFEGKPVKSLRTIGAIYSSVSNWMAPVSSGLVYVHDLAGKRASVGPQGSTTDIAARISLQSSGLSSSNTILYNSGLGSGSADVQNGKIDAVHGFAGIPISGLTELAEAVPSRLLKYTPEELKNILSQNSFYFKTVIPSGTYPGQTEDVDTFGIKCLLCVDEDMDEELVYNITKILDESVPELSMQHESLSSLNKSGYMYSALSIPLHPGAERYYIESGNLFAQ